MFAKVKGESRNFILTCSDFGPASSRFLESTTLARRGADFGAARVVFQGKARRPKISKRSTDLAHLSTFLMIRS
jgi:hypothetical protein